MAQKWISKYLSDEAIAEISQAVHTAELGTAGDIVPMIVRRSSAVRHVPVVLALCFTLVFLGVEMLGLNGWYVSDFVPFLVGHWIYQLLFLLLLLVLAWGLSHLHPVQRLLTSDQDEKEQVERRAQLEFFLHHLHRTHRKTAVLIFVSVMEKRAVILADEGLAKHLPPHIWEEVLKPLTGFLHKGQWSQGFQDAIRRSGELLKQHVPPNEAAASEISNNLIVKE